MTDRSRSVLLNNMSSALPSLRRMLGVSQTELSEMLGMSRSTVANIENRRKEMSWSVFLSLVFIFSGNSATAAMIEPLGLRSEDLSALLKADVAPSKDEEEQKRVHSVIAGLSDDFDLIFKVDLSPNKYGDVSERYRVTQRYIRAIPGIDKTEHFHDILDLIAEYLVVEGERDAFLAATRREKILSELSADKAYFYNFPVSGEGISGYGQIKFTPVFSNEGLLTAIICGIHEADRESVLIRREKKSSDVIAVLSYEYNAVYYCNADDGDYDILFQQGFVKEELNRMKLNFPKFDGAFEFFVSMLVHPDDREMMHVDLMNVEERLKGKKSFKREFRRKYGEKYLYTQMICVRTNSADEPLHSFVVGFAENDAEYRNLADQQKQLEHIVTERTIELQERNETLNRINEDIIALLANLTEARDLESGEHIRRVKGFSRILATQIQNDWPEYGLGNDSVELITSASMLHDIGKIMIPDAILNKPGRLTKEEFEIIKSHCDRGCDILENAPKDWSPAYRKTGYEICRYHHEKYDGSGYPCGLKGEEIPISAQIVSVADCFDALTTKRVYKDAYSYDTAFNMILGGECGVFSEKILASFRACKEQMFEHAANPAIDVRSAMPAGMSTCSLSWTKILYVDDNSLMRDLGESLLESEGAEVKTASSGIEAIEVFSASRPGEFNAILMDVIMPEMDGTAATAVIRGLDRPDARSIPIIALTSMFSDEDMNRCLDAGMDSFISKPISVASLLKVLYECLGRSNETLGLTVRKTGQEAAARINDIFAQSEALPGAVRDYDLVCYISGTTNDVPVFICTPELEKILNTISIQLPGNRRLDSLFRQIVPEKNFDEFLEDVNRNKIESFVTSNGAYSTYVPVCIDGRSCLMRFRFVPDDQKPGNFVLAMKKTE